MCIRDSDDPPRDVFSDGIKGSHQHPGAIRSKSRTDTFCLYRLRRYGGCNSILICGELFVHFYSPNGSLKLMSVLWSVCISASASRKASVDSEPWFWLTRSTCRPSRQPPVLGSYSSSPRSFRPRNHSKARRASAAQDISPVALYASMQADAVAWASIGCWSNSARSSHLWKNPFEPTGRNEPASDVWTLTSQRSVLM